MEIGLLGHGTVGSGIDRIITSANTQDTQKLHIKRILVKDQSEVTDERMTVSFDDILKDKSIDTVAECMGGIHPAYEYVSQALRAHKNAVTSNKKMLAHYYAELMQMAQENHVTLKYEAAVAGGIPWIEQLNRTKRIDEISDFHGIFNGTTNYILSNMTENGIRFDEALALAQKKGYAEQNPSDDIDGMDVRYKVFLSCAAAYGMLADLNSIAAYGIRNISVQDIEYARQHNRTVKMIGRGHRNANTLSCSAMPAFVDHANPLSHISQNLNACVLDSDTLGTIMLTGQGAGSLPTAHAAVQDLIDIEKGIGNAYMHADTCLIDNQLNKSVYYIRSKKEVCFSGIIDEMAGEDAFLSIPVSLDEASSLILSADDLELFIAEVMK